MDWGRSSALSLVFAALWTRGSERDFLRPNGFFLSIDLRLFLPTALLLASLEYFVVQILFLPLPELVSIYMVVFVSFSDSVALVSISTMTNTQFDECGGKRTEGVGWFQWGARTEQFAFSLLDVHGTLLVELARVAALAEVLVRYVITIDTHAVDVLPHTKQIRKGTLISDIDKNK